MNDSVFVMLLHIKKELHIITRKAYAILKITVR